MFKDKKEELQRLEEELLLEADQEEEEALLAEELEEAEILLDDPADFGEETEETYYNYSNRYGTLHAYNSDLEEEAMEAYSRQVYQDRSKRSARGLTVLALCLTGAILCVAAWCVLRFMGVLE